MMGTVDSFFHVLVFHCGFDGFFKSLFYPVCAFKMVHQKGMHKAFPLAEKSLSGIHPCLAFWKSPIHYCLQKTSSGMAAKPKMHLMQHCSSSLLLSTTFIWCKSGKVKATGPFGKFLFSMLLQTVSFNAFNGNCASYPERQQQNLQEHMKQMGMFSSMPNRVG